MERQNGLRQETLKDTSKTHPLHTPKQLVNVILQKNCPPQISVKGPSARASSQETMGIFLNGLVAQAMTCQDASAHEPWKILKGPALPAVSHQSGVAACKEYDQALDPRLEGRFLKKSKNPDSRRQRGFAPPMFPARGNTY